MQISRLYHTLRHLKSRQITGQLSRRIFSFRHCPSRVANFKAGAFPGIAWNAHPIFLTPSIGKNSREDIRNGKFEFLNEAADLGFPPRWPEGSRMKLLWEYNLHYFDWIHALPFQDATDVALDWIDQHPPSKEFQAWAPYPTSLRILNWIIFFFKNHQSEIATNSDLRRQLWESIAQQTTYLKENLETHLLGNHFFENITTLAFVGACFKGHLAEECRFIASAELPAQISEQFLPDGLHFELSPMYHVRMVYLLSLLVSLQDSRLTAIASPTLRRSLAALNSIRHPDGEIALLNDSAIGIYHNPTSLIEWGSKALNSIESPLPSPEPQIGTWKLPDAGYYGFQDLDLNYLICDAGPPGPDYIPGHAHADIFTYEVSLRGVRVIVDTGNHNYETGETRNYCRSTKAHNTVELAGRDQCDLWGSFRVGQRGYPAKIVFEEKETGFRLSGHHTGYARTELKAVHERTFDVSPSFSIKITDVVKALRPIPIKSYVHLAPDCKIVHRSEQEIMVKFRKGRFTISFNETGKLELKSTAYYPEFGLRKERTSLCYSTSGDNVRISYSITPC